MPPWSGTDYSMYDGTVKTWVPIADAHLIDPPSRLSVSEF